MPNWGWWVWLLIALAVIAIIAAIVALTSRSKKVNREKAAALRDRAAGEASLLGAARGRTEDLNAQAEATHTAAEQQAARAAELRAQAEEAEEAAALAAQDAELIGAEAQRSAEALEEAQREHEDMLREADRLDPDVATDGEGSRVRDDLDAETDEMDAPEAPATRTTADSAASGWTLSSTSDDSTSSGATALDEAPAAHSHAPLHHDAVQDTAPAHAAPQDLAHDDHDAPARAEDIFDEDHPRDELGRRLDPYGQPIETEYHEPPARSEADDVDHEVSRDAEGRRLDPYGNPIPEDR